MSTANNLKSLAKESFGIKFTNDACAFEIKQLINQMIFLENQVDELDVKIKYIYDKLDNHLLSVPGVGKVLAPVILAEIGDINTFDKPSKLTAFTGIALLNLNLVISFPLMKKLLKEVPLILGMPFMLLL